MRPVEGQSYLVNPVTSLNLSDGSELQLVNCEILPGRFLNALNLEPGQAITGPRSFSATFKMKPGIFMLKFLGRGQSKKQRRRIGRYIRRSDGR